MRTVKRFQGFHCGALSYEWEITQDDCKVFHFKLNGCKINSSNSLSSVMYDLKASIIDFLTHERAEYIELKGIA